STTILANNATTRYVRLYISDAGIDNHARIPEFEVYGSAGSTPPPPPPTAGPLTNGSFEDAVQGNGVGQGWSSFSSTGYGANYAVVSDQVQSGSYAQQVLSPQPSTTDQYAGVYQVFGTESGTRYTVRAWNQTQFSGGSAWDHIARLGIDLTGGTDFRGGSVAWYEFDSAKETWHLLERNVTATGSSMTIFLQSWRKWASGGDAYTWFDDVEVIADGQPPEPGNNPPTAAATANPTSGDAPLTVSFDATGSSDPDGDSLSFSWDFGDGSQGSGAIVSHTYQGQGIYPAILTVDDGRGASDDVTATIAVSTTGAPLPSYCPSTLNFPAIRAQLNQQGEDLGFVKIGFHVGPGGNQSGLGEWMRCLDAAGVPFFLKSADSAGQIWEAAQLKAASGVPHVLVYRKSVGDGWNPDVPDYNLSPYDAAVQHWQRHRDAFPPELVQYKHLIWLETINEIDKNRAEWLGEFAYHTAQMAMAEGFNWAAFGWSSGEPEREHWEGPWMRQFLELAGNNPDRVAVALHEYSYTRDNIDRYYPDLVGRFQMLFDVCDSYDIPRPNVVITEFGWEYQNVAGVGQARPGCMPIFPRCWAQPSGTLDPDLVGLPTRLKS
ncbi:MAG: PKD domain-containing protein, partial [Planctomycetota bacterium]